MNIDYWKSNHLYHKITKKEYLRNELKSCYSCVNCDFHNNGYKSGLRCVNSDCIFWTNSNYVCDLYKHDPGKIGMWV